MKKIKAVAALFAFAIIASSAKADIFTYHFLLDGGQEVPPVTTTATGSCTVTLNDSTNQVSASCTYSGLSSNANNAHIHTGALGVSGPPIVNLSFTAATSGTASVTNDPLSPAEVTAMKDGDTYINIHSVNHGGGEIRGQVVASLPAVSTWGMLAMAILVGTAGTLTLRRRNASLA